MMVFFFLGSLLWFLSMSQLGYRFVDRTQNLLYSKVRSMDDSYQVNFNAGMYDENVIYNDEDILVVDKPANMQTAPGFISHESLATKMANAYGILRVDRMVVHRLDYATSGVVVFAKNENACKNLHKSFRTSNCVKKVYTSIVAGSLEGKLSGVVDLPIGRDKQRGPPFYKIGQNCSTAKASISHWEVMDCGETASMVRLRPVTGRTHQLRLHMTAIGHPILGDFFYGQQQPIFTIGDSSSFTDQRSAYDRADRLLLHAEELHFVHPRTLIDMKFRADCPFSLQDYL